MKHSSTIICTTLVLVGLLLIPRDLRNFTASPRKVAEDTQFFGDVSDFMNPTKIAIKLKHKDRRGRRSAAKDLFCLGPAATPALDDIVSGLRDSDDEVRIWCAYTLHRISHLGAKAGVPNLMEMLKDKSVEVRRAAAFTLDTVGRDAKEAHDLLVTSLKDEDSGVRIHCAGALAQIDPKKSEYIVLFADGLDDEKFINQVLPIFEVIGLPAVPTLEKRLQDEKPRVRLTATGAFASIARNGLRKNEKFTPNTIGLLIIAVKDDDEQVAANAIRVLGMLREDAKEAIPPIVASLRHPSRHVRCMAAETLQAFGRSARVAIPALAQAVSDQDEFVRRAAKRTLEFVKPPAQE